jgi:hypothetical protein
MGVVGVAGDLATEASQVGGIISSWEAEGSVSQQ